MNTPAGALLGRKGSTVFSVAPSTTVADAVHVMNQNKVGCLVVLESDRVAGIFTERDVLTRVVAANLDPRSTRVDEVMTSSVITITAVTTVGEIMNVFTSKRCRHLPVVENNHLLGLISIGDVSRWLVDSHRAEAEHLRRYIDGEVAP